MKASGGGDPDLLGLTESEIDEECDTLFRDTPITFQPRPNYILDLKIKQIILDMKFTIPILAINGNLYLIGNKKYTCDL